MDGEFSRAKVELEKFLKTELFDQFVKKGQHESINQLMKCINTAIDGDIKKEVAQHLFKGMDYQILSGDLNKAIKEFTSAIILDEEYPIAYSMRIDAYLTNGQNKETTVDYYADSCKMFEVQKDFFERRIYRQLSNGPLKKRDLEKENDIGFFTDGGIKDRWKTALQNLKDLGKIKYDKKNKLFYLAK